MPLFHVLFDFSSGLSKPIIAKPGTLDRIMSHLEEVETELGFKLVPTGDGFRWEYTVPPEGVSDEVFCRVAERHNEFVYWLYKDFEKWSEEPFVGGEEITPEDAKIFWRGLRRINVPLHRWTRDYYMERMQSLYEVMRGREDDGVEFGARKLTEKQAAAVVGLFAQWLDRWDVRLDVPKGCDHLDSDGYGSAIWCDGCHALIAENNVWSCRKKKCPLKMEDDDE